MLSAALDGTDVHLTWEVARQKAWLSAPLALHAEIAGLSYAEQHLNAVTSALMSASMGTVQVGALYAQ